MLPREVSECAAIGEEGIERLLERGEEWEGKRENSEGERSGKERGVGGIMNNNKEGTQNEKDQVCYFRSLALTNMYSIHSMTCILIIHLRSTCGKEVSRYQHCTVTCLEGGV